MTQHPLALAVALALATSVFLSGCDSTAGFTEQEHIQRAKDFEDKGDIRSSILELKNAIQKNPDNPQARFLLGQVYLKAGLGAEAEKELLQAKRLGVGQESLNQQLGEAWLLMGEYQQILDKILPDERASKAQLARVLRLRGEALLRLGKLKEACNLLNQSLEVDAAHAPTYWGLSRCAIAESNVEKATELLRTALNLPERQAQTWLFIGDLEQFKRNSQGAIDAYSSALKHEPDNLEARFNRAAVHIRLNNLDAARADTKRIQELAPKSIVAYHSAALMDLAQKKYPEARSSLQNLLRIQPNYLPGLLLAGAVEFALGNFQTAESHLSKVVNATPTNGNARWMLANAQLRLGRLEDAAKSIAVFDVDRTENVALLSLAGEIAAARKEFAKATHYFEAASKLKPEDPTIRTGLGFVRSAKGDASAMRDFEVAAGLEQTFGQAHAIVVLRQLKAKQFDPALETIAHAERKSGTSPLLANYRGVAYLGKNDRARARRSFDQALQLDPRFLPAASNLAMLDVLDKKPELARQRFMTVLEKDPGNVRVMMALADLAASQKSEKDYLLWLERAIKADPRAIAPRAALIRYYVATKDNKKALSAATDAVNASPDSLAAMNLLGGAQMATGQVENALSTFTRLAAKTPSSPDVLLRLSLAQMASNKNVEARASLNRALQIKPDHMPSLETLLKLELAEKKPTAALQVAQRMEKLHPASPRGYSWQGDILVSLKRPKEAVNAYTQALERGAPATNLIKLLGAMNAAGAAKSAERYLEGWLAKHPDDQEALFYAARLYMSSGRNRQAIAHYESLIRINPTDVGAFNNLAILYQREQDPRALATAERAMKLAPNNPGVMDTFGWILVNQGQLDKGLDVLRAARDKAPKVGTIHFHYAAALARIGNKSSARRELRALVDSGLAFPELDEAKLLLKGL